MSESFMTASEPIKPPCFRLLLFIALAVFLVAVPAGAAPGANGTAQQPVPLPQHVNVSVYVTDFSRFDITAGTFGVDFNLILHSDTPVSIDDMTLVNGMMTSVSTIVDTPHDKEYRIIAVLTTDPDLSRYPFDRQTLVIRLEPRTKDESGMVLSVDPLMTVLNQRETGLPGWKFTGNDWSVTNHSYLTGQVPYSRVNFEYGISRELTSTLLKFFLPLFLIIIVSIASLMMKVSSRLGLNASMFLAAVLIHWRIADAIPLVAYVTFLDIFMVITYVTLVMVLTSGILILKYTESGNRDMVERVNYWSLRIIPLVCVVLYSLLFLSIAV